MTRSGITPVAAVATVAAALDAGIVHLDTAYCYGEAGESERAIAQAITGRRRDAVVIASKCGIHWEPGRKQCVNGRPERIRGEVEESLTRLGTDHVDLLYLHAPDPTIPIEASAGALSQLLAEGKTRAVGVSFVFTRKLAQELLTYIARIICRTPSALKTRSNFWFTSFQHKICN
jgi:aryl-alcohol dehydrogenase-like predicted oxidoreductase